MVKSSCLLFFIGNAICVDLILIGVLECDKSRLGVIVMQDKMLSVEEVAGELRVNPETVRVWIRTGELVAFSIGKGYRISRTDLDDFIKRRRTDYKKRRDENEES
jgi:excisionase family DNA binding protein